MATCDMEKDCTAPVTHIGSKGYVYCAEHAADRTRCSSTSETCRKMKKWELDLIAAGKPLPSYKPTRKPAAPISDPIERMYAEAFEEEPGHCGTCDESPCICKAAPTAVRGETRITSAFLELVALGTYTDGVIVKHVRAVAQQWTPEAIAKRRAENDAAHDRREG